MKTKTPQFLNFAAPGMMLSIVFIFAITLTALMFVLEKKEGLLDRSWIAGGTTTEIIASHIIVNFFIQFIRITFLLIFVYFVFKVWFYFYIFNLVIFLLN